MSTKPRVARSRAPAAGLLALAAALHATAARAEVQARFVEGEMVYTSRPDRKPSDRDATAPGPSRRSTGAPARLGPLLDEVSRRHGMDPKLIATVIGVESGFDEMAVSPKGARGLMQLMPETARLYGVQNVHDARDNVEAGVAYLKDLTRRYDGNLRLALAAYNAGPEAVERAGGVPNYRETRTYIRRIEARYGRDLERALGGRATASGLDDGSVRATTDPEGQVLFTNRGASRLTLIRRPAGSGS